MIVYEKGDVQRVSASELCSILNDWKRQNKAISVENFGPGIRMPPVYIKKYKTGIKGFRNRNIHEYYLDEFWARLFFGFDSEDSKYNFFIHLNQQMSEYTDKDDYYKRHEVKPYLYKKTDNYETVSIPTDNLHTEYCKHFVMQVKL